MVGFGLVGAALFPFVMIALGVARDQAPRLSFFGAAFLTACLGTGLPMGVINYSVTVRTFRDRIGVLSARLEGAQSEIVSRAGGDSWEPLADRYALPVDSTDEFGRANASFNYLVSALDTSQMAERSLRHSLVDQAKLAALGTLTAGVAHEMKNPLNFVMNFTALNLELCAELREQTTDDDELVADLEANLNLVLHHTERALAVMTTMLEVGRSRTDDDAQPCRLNPIVKQSTGLADHSWQMNRRDARCAIHVELDDDDPTVRGFEGDLIQVIINLVINALEAASLATDRQGEVRIAVRHDDQSAFVTVTDNGPGMEPETLSHIFEPFFTTKHGRGGTGLGLSISKDIVDNHHHGELKVSSEPGTGTRFVVKLPLQQ